MEEELDILFDEQAITQRVSVLASQISCDHQGKELILVCVLKGAAMFTADLARRLTIPARLAFVQAASYGSGTASSGVVTVTKDIDMEIEGKHVVIVDGILDSGRTLDNLIKRYQERKPASLKVAVLLDKHSRRTVEVPVDYRGFEIPDVFVVGYGMDAAEQYRNLPYVAVLKTTE
ncbi:MAG: hypoxanthine phosphoribosyltransferase [Nitrospirota bacterium]